MKYSVEDSMANLADALANAGDTGDAGVDFRRTKVPGEFKLLRYCECE